MILASLELFAFLAAGVLAVLWVRNPNGNYEPWVAIFSLVTAGIELYRRLHPKKKEEHLILTVIRDELRWNLQRLASQIAHTIDAPKGFVMPRRSGETEEHFEARARNEFAREIECFFSKYQQFALFTQTFDAQRTNVSVFEEIKRRSVEEVYKAIDEVKSQVSLFRDYLHELLYSSGSDSSYRTRMADFYKKQAATELRLLWF
ncbi:MAG TPA: hypothetical protein VNN09_08995 [Candidatus Competibacteraceae bacterium]|nr:hypothetical protein [Candidatus Competibacteraceae bacterium]